MKRPRCPRCNELLFDIRELGYAGVPAAEAVPVDELALVGDCDRCRDIWNVSSRLPLTVER